MFENTVLREFSKKGKYLERSDMKELVDFMKLKGVKLHTLHTSGHADVMTVENLIKDVSPKAVIPIHTENAEWSSKHEEVKVIFVCKDYLV